jgi:O-antigen ligase
VVFLIWSTVKYRQEEGTRIGSYQRPINLSILLLTLYLLGGPRHSLFNSATSTYACTAGLVVCALVYIRERSGKRVREGFLMAIISFVIVLGVASVYARGSGIRFFASSAGRDATLTGRTEVWASLLPVVKANPIVGKGFGGFWTARTRDFYAISGAHSGYLDVLLGIGFVGLALVSAFLISSGRKARRELPGDFLWGLSWLCYLVMSVVHNVGESSLDTFSSPLTAILLFFAVSSVTTPPEESEAFES